MHILDCSHFVLACDFICLPWVRHSQIDISNQDSLFSSGLTEAPLGFLSGTANSVPLKQFIINKLQLDPWVLSQESEIEEMLAAPKDPCRVLFPANIGPSQPPYPSPTLICALSLATQSACPRSSYHPWILAPFLPTPSVPLPAVPKHACG